MTLEDFFTLTEIKDGLTVTSRVEELVSVMQSNKDSVLKNNGDASRQWTAVASTIAATKNRDCLDVFVNLDGLVYLSSWLAEAQMLANDSVDRSVEESILALLEAVENLGVDSSKLVSSGILVAVKKLVDHGSSRVQDQARKLFGSWKDKDVYDHSEHDSESCNKIHEDEMRVVAASMESSGQKSAVTLCSTQSNNEKQCPEIADEALLSGCSEGNIPDQDKGLELQNDKAGFDSNVNSHCSNTMTETETFNGSSTDDIMKEVQEKLSVKEKSSMRETSGPTIFGTMPTGSSSLLYLERDSAEGPSNAPVGAEIPKEKQMANYFLEKLGEAGTSSAAGHVAVSSDSMIASMELEKNSLLQSSLDSNEVSKNASETICGSHDASVAHNSKQVSSLTHIQDNQDSDNSSRLSGGLGRSRKYESDNLTALADNEGKDDMGHSDKKRRVKRRKKRSSSRSMTISQRLGAIDKTTTDIDLGILDALEVATKVAQEVAREVDSGEPSHSSSEELSDESGQSGSQDSRDDDVHTGSPSKGLSVGENHSFEEPHAGDDDVMDEKDDKPESAMKNSDDVEESHLAAAAKSEVGREKSPCGFDLNQDICPDEADVIMSSISTAPTPMSVSFSVSSSGMPAGAPLQLERSLSGKGSAATSVFHPILPHKVPSGDLREKQVISRGIDLNVAELGDDQVEDLTPWKQFPFSSSNSRGGESSHEASRRGSSRFNLDLNCMNEDDEMPPPSELKMETRLFLSHNGQQIASPVSSSSVAQQSGKEVNFDLNDRPQFFIDSRDQGPYYGRHPWSTASYGGHKLEEPGISILGTKVDVDRKESVSQMASFLSNGKSLEPAAGLYMGRTGTSLGLAPGVSFSPAPIYGYNGMSGPPGLSMSSPMYVPGTAIPYMVDSRGTPVMMPQIIGSTPYVQPPFPQQHMFMSLAGGSPSMNGSVRPNFDQNPGFGLEMGNRESINLRQFLSPSQIGAMGEHSGANVEPSSSSSISIGGKRKEPETRWEFPPWR
ncbi:TFIIS/LEDGF domain superfamily [Arabidopsis suecica]|uniref:TFIIS/LEDGF domain superfamily n=1 Tax=Arabidopsis suecica TaxID=45249 RepID=A0A8T1YJG5_ARASU|nr:TFIIS/LEDGF domain superfamily [Arabidopsis suecica]